MAPPSNSPATPGTKSKTKKKKSKQQAKPSTPMGNTPISESVDTGTPDVTFNKKMTVSKLKLLDSSPLNDLLTVRDLQCAVAEVVASKPSSKKRTPEKQAGNKSKKRKNVPSDDNSAALPPVFPAILDYLKKESGTVDTPVKPSAAETIPEEGSTPTTGTGKKKRKQRGSGRAVPTEAGVPVIDPSPISNADELKDSEPIKEKAAPDSFDKKKKKRATKVEILNEANENKAKISKAKISKEKTLKAKTPKAKTTKVKTPKVKTPKVKTSKAKHSESPDNADIQDEVAEKALVVKQILDAEEVEAASDHAVVDDEAQSIEDSQGNQDMKMKKRKAPKARKMRPFLRSNATENDAEEASKEGKQKEGDKMKQIVGKLEKAGKIAKQKKDAGSDEVSSVVYLGHIPHGFYEKEMQGYFSQFGTVSRVRLSRAKKSGRSRGYAFIEFADEAVAVIAAEAMDGYIMHGSSLVAKVVPAEKVHPDIFKPRTREIRTIKWSTVERRALLKRSTDPTKIAKRSKRIQKTMLKKKERLAGLNISYKFPTVHAK